MENIALHKPTVQSGTISPALWAVDSNLNPSQCTSTGDMTDPWWSVDLLRQTIVTHVSVATCGKNIFPATVNLYHTIYYKHANPEW